MTAAPSPFADDASDVPTAFVAVTLTKTELPRTKLNGVPCRVASATVQVVVTPSIESQPVATLNSASISLNVTV